MRRRPLIALLVLAAASFALHADRAAHPTSSYQSADERSYGKLAIDLAENRQYGSRQTRMRDPLHWPPGAPVLFAAGHALFGSEESLESFDLPVAYWLQAVLALGTMLAAFGLGWALAGIWPGVAAAGLVGLYPPLILATGEQLSEPLGAFLLAAGMCVLAISARAGRWAGMPVAGLLLGLLVLTRADLLLVPFLTAAIVALWQWRGRRDGRRALGWGAALAAGAVVAIAPWTIYASLRADAFVPVTKGSAAPLFIGTYLPGDGHTVGMKRALEAEVKRFRPGLRPIPAFEIEAANYLDMIAARRPGLSRDAAVRREARENLRRYALGDPLEFAVLMGDKVQRMWTRYARGGARPTSWLIRAWHVLLVAGAFAGMALGAWRRRSVPIALVLVAALYSTALHTLVISQARYNLPLMPVVLTAGLAGWVLWWRGRGAVSAAPGAR